MAVDIKEAAKRAGVSEEEMQKAMDLLNKDKVRRAKIASGEIKGGKKWSELTEAEKNKFRAANKRRAVKHALILAKAEAKGITVTEAEIDSALAKVKK